LSTFRPGPRNVIQEDSGAFVFRLRKGETVVFIGIFDIAVSEGAVTILGAFLHNNSKTCRVVAPSTHSLPPVIARADAIVHITSAKSSLQRLEALSPLFRNIWAHNNDKSQSFRLLLTSNDDAMHRSLDVVECDRETDGFLSTALSSTDYPVRKVAISIGGKSTGKSTMNRLLLNSALRKHPICLYLDLDPGQPEFGPPGQISLVKVSKFVLRPPFANYTINAKSGIEVLKSHTIAANSFKDDPDHYVACVRDLFENFERRFNNQPLIINPCGWINGTGSHILRDLVHLVKPSVALILEPLDQETTLWIDAVLQSVVVKQHRVLRRQIRPSSRTPAELRAMQTMVYFHSQETPSLDREAQQALNLKTISHFHPWIVSYAGPHAAVTAVVSYGSQPNPCFLPELLNGATVAVVTVDVSESSSAAEETSHRRTSLSVSGQGHGHALPYLTPDGKGILLPPKPKHSNCVGLALVRAIDNSTKTIQLITPIPSSQIATLSGLSRHVILVRGSFDSPEWAYLEDLYQKGDSTANEGEHGLCDENVKIRPWVSRRGMVGIESAVWRLRHQP
ncbi:hypothetical protein K431DRAFT_196883, partial [Polychaeton citri CBS 116435]